MAVASHVLAQFAGQIQVSLEHETTDGRVQAVVVTNTSEQSIRVTAGEHAMTFPPGDTRIAIPGNRNRFPLLDSAVLTVVYPAP